jgi:sec-independent protein translocase protein TatB
MFDLSWSHIAILVVVALIVLGPKELPNAIRTGAQLLRAGRKLAGEFRSGVDELVREAELDETRRSIKQAMTEGLDNTIGKTVDPDGELKSTLETDLTADQPALDQAPRDQLTGPMEPQAEVVIHDPPPAPPNSIVPPPDVPAIDTSTAADIGEPQPQSQPSPAPGDDEAAKTDEDLKKSA